jgi:hypothetical protein
MRSPSLGCIPEPRNYAREARTTSDAPPEKPRRCNEILRLTGCLLRGFLCAAGATLGIAKTALSAQEMASPQRYFGSLLPTGRRLHASQRPVPSRVPANGWPALPPPPRNLRDVHDGIGCFRQSAAPHLGGRCPEVFGYAGPFPHGRLRPRDEILAVPQGRCPGCRGRSSAEPPTPLLEGTQLDDARPAVAAKTPVVADTGRFHPCGIGAGAGRAAWPYRGREALPAVIRKAAKT